MNTPLIPIDLEPDIVEHFIFHRRVLLQQGIQVDIECIIAHRIGLRVRQIDYLDVRIPLPELRERAEAIFRFLPYFPVIRVEAARRRALFPV